LKILRIIKTKRAIQNGSNLSTAGHFGHSRYKALQKGFDASPHTNYLQIFKERYGRGGSVGGGHYSYELRAVNPYFPLSFGVFRASGSASRGRAV
jgi:hypothetical protein